MLLNSHPGREIIISFQEIIANATYNQSPGQCAITRTFFLINVCIFQEKESISKCILDLKSLASRQPAAA